ncbi:MAG: phosphatase PAP2 family protein [Candidatus Helarchaeota archaeon]
MNIQDIKNWDAKWACKINNLKINGVLQWIFKIGTHLCSNIIWLPLLGIIYLIFLRDNILLLFLVSSMVVDLFIEMPSKFAFKRRRPFASPHPKCQIVKRDLMRAKRNSSFPSGHAMLAMEYLFSFALYTPAPYNMIYTIIWILIAIFIGFSRVYLGVHFPTDVFIGFLLGITVGLITYLVFPWIKQVVFTTFSYINNLLI